MKIITLNVLNQARAYKKLFNFEIQKCGQILCAHKTHFLMPGHIYVLKYFLSITTSWSWCARYTVIGWDSYK